MPWLVAYPPGLPIKDANGRLFGIDLGYDLPEGDAFRRACKQKFNQQAQTASAVYAYDGMKMLGDVLKKSNGEGADELGEGQTASARSFSGATGRIAFDRDGQRSSVPLTQPIGFAGGSS